MRSSSRNLVSVALMLPMLLALLLAGSGCASVGNFLGLPQGREATKPISNPFAGYRPGVFADSERAIVLRTKKGDRSVEIEIPGDTQSMSEFVIPVSPAFKEGRSLASSGAGDANSDMMDESYKDRTPSFSDREITARFSQGMPEDDAKRKQIEQGLFLAPSTDENMDDKSSSYLAGMDRIKQLYRLTRYEVALLETDAMIKGFPTDSKLHEMRGTLLDRLGRRGLALKSWNQALRFDPKNEGLRRFIDRKTASTHPTETAAVGP